MVGMSLITTYGVLALSTLIYLWRWLYPSKQRLNHIPTVGISAPILSYLNIFRWATNSSEMVAEGYRKYKGRAFKVLNFTRWVVILSGPTLLEEIRKSRDDEFSLHHALDSDFCLTFAIGFSFSHSGYHSKIVRTTLTSSMHILFPLIQDELETSCSTRIPIREEWVSVAAYDAIVDVMAQVTNRVFVGLPYCRDPVYLNAMAKFAIGSMFTGRLLAPFPEWLRPLVCRIVTILPKSVDTALRVVGPEIERRLRCRAKYGPEYPDKPFDFLEWIIDTIPDDERTVRNVCIMLMINNLGAIHTSSSVIAFSLYQIAANPEYAAILRHEVEELTQSEGWSKDSVANLHKMDSLIKECLRFYSVSNVNVFREAMKDCTLSDGTFIPKGTTVMTVVLPMQLDPDVYEDATVFKPWRYSDQRERDGESVKLASTYSAPNFLSFGYGRNACPGRYYALSEIKQVLAHLVMTYDIKMNREGVVPAPMSFGTNVIPDNKAHVIFRKRRS